MSSSESPQSARRRFARGERVQVRCEQSGIVRDGYVHRAFSSGNHTVILDRPLSGGRRIHCQPGEVFPPAQDELFGTHMRASATSTGAKRQP